MFYVLFWTHRIWCLFANTHDLWWSNPNFTDTVHCWYSKKIPQIITHGALLRFTNPGWGWFLLDFFLVCLGLLALVVIPTIEQGAQEGFEQVLIVTWWFVGPLARSLGVWKWAQNSQNFMVMTHDLHFVGKMVQFLSPLFCTTKGDGSQFDDLALGDGWFFTMKKGDVMGYITYNIPSLGEWNIQN